SAPSRNVTGPARSSEESGSPPCASSATRRPRIRSQLPMGTRQSDPALARTAFGDVGSAQPSDRTTAAPKASAVRSEEHTSELQSRQYLVCRLLLEKKK